jgi:hypothetical protein
LAERSGEKVSRQASEKLPGSGAGKKFAGFGGFVLVI